MDWLDSNVSNGCKEPNVSNVSNGVKESKVEISVP